MESLKQNYAFDIIVVKSSLQPKNDDECHHKYSIRVFREFIDLPKNRLFVANFPSTPLGEFLASPCDLVGSLSSKGVCVTIYENEKMLGCGNGRLSSSLLCRLADPTLKVNELIHVELEQNKKRVAGVDINIKFSSTDPDLDTRLLPFGCYDVCRPLDKSVNPRDVIFTLGRSGRCGAVSCITDERLMTHAGAPFSCMHKKSEPSGGDCGCVLRGVKPPPELDPARERERTLLKKLLVDLDIDKVHVPTPPSGHEHSRRQCKCPRGRTSSDSNTFGSSECWKDAEDDSERLQASKFDVDLTPQQIEELEAARRHALGVCPVIPPPELIANKYTPPLLCPVCKANITWLPKVAACPYCGYKRFEMEKPSEEPFDETATAAEVLRNHFLSTQLEGERKHSRCAIGKGASSSSAKLTKDCSCKKGRVCTRCRIQELCDQIFKMSSTTKLKHKPDAQLPAPQQPQQQQQPSVKDVKKTPSTASKRRQELVKIFTDMRKVYTDNKSAKEKSEMLLRDCDAECRKVAKMSKSPRGRRRAACVLKNALKELEQSYPSKKLKARTVKPKTKRRFKSKRYTFLVRKDIARPASAHESCARDHGRVPCHMGWLWTESELGRHSCWKPGAIKKPIRQLMAYFLRDYPADRMVNSRFHYRRRPTGKAPVEEEPLIQHPTLHITKKHDEYIITLRPLKDPKTLAVAANPYANMKPVVFRISKDPIATGKRNIKLSLKEKGYPVCHCQQPIASCCCRSHIDQKIVAHEVRTLSEERGWADISDSFVYSDVSESDSENELEFGVTPPAGVVKPERLRKPDRVNCETQYNDNDWAMPTMYPHPPTALTQYGACVTGERKNRFPWILGKGFVHREPRPAKKINRPKKEKKSKENKAKGRLQGGCDAVAPPFQTDYARYAEMQATKRDWHKSNGMGSRAFYDSTN